MWLAVEVMRGEAYSLKSDVYSYGIILWELVACKPPFYEHLGTNLFWFDLEQKIIAGMLACYPGSNLRWSMKKCYQASALPFLASAQKILQLSSEIAGAKMLVPGHHSVKYVSYFHLSIYNNPAG